MRKSEERERITAADVRDDAGWVTVRNDPGSFRTDGSVGGHGFVVDEPTAVGGTDAGPTPYDFLLGAIGACTAMTLRMYATRKGWPLGQVVVRLRHGRSYGADCEQCESRKTGIEHIEREVELDGALSDEQRARLMGIADRCPVKQTLESGIRVHARA